MYCNLTLETILIKDNDGKNTDDIYNYIQTQLLISYICKSYILLNATISACSCTACTDSRSNAASSVNFSLYCNKEQYHLYHQVCNKERFNILLILLKLEISTFESLLCFLNLVIFAYRKLQAEKDGKFSSNFGSIIYPKKICENFRFSIQVKVQFSLQNCFF